MENSSIVFLLVALSALLLAGFLTWNLLYPKQAEGYNDLAIGSVPNTPEHKAMTKAVTQFKKTKESDDE